MSGESQEHSVCISQQTVPAYVSQGSSSPTLGVRWDAADLEASLETSGQGQKRKWRGRSFIKPSISEYLVKRSRKDPSQQLGIDWATSKARDAFLDYLEALLGERGVGLEFKGACILLPADLAPLDPLEVMKVLRFKNCPLAKSERPRYHYADHSTTVSRAAAWFGKWPRRGIDADNFVDSTTY